MHKIKTAGSLLWVTLVLGAISATGASGASVYSETEPLVVDGKQLGTNVLTVNGGALKCNEIKYTSKLHFGSPLSGMVIIPQFINCTLEPYGSAHVTSTGCDYELTPKEITFEVDAHTQMDITCGAGSITIVGTALGVTKCTVHIPSQAIPVTMTNQGSSTGREIILEMDATKIKYTQTAGTGFGACTTETAENGKLNGVSTLSGTTEDGVAQGVWVK